MMIFLPVVYMLAGWGLGRMGIDGRRLASMLLSRYAIPVVIIWNVATQFTLMGITLSLSIAVMGVVYMASQYFSRDPVQRLCFCYLNIGWLGLPIGTLLFGTEAATLMIAAYVGSSIFGNTLGTRILSNDNTNIKRLITSPPILSVAIGIALIPFHTLLTHYALFIYTTAKLAMSILGMAVLGLWLSNTQLCLSDVYKSIWPTLRRILIWAVIVTATALALHSMGVILTEPQWETLYLICLLPPAANIIVLETHYAGTGRSAITILCSTLISLALIMMYGGTMSLMHFF